MSGRLQSCRGLSRLGLLFGFGFYAVVVFFHNVAVWFGGVVAAETVHYVLHDALNTKPAHWVAETKVPAVAKAPLTPVSVQ